MCESVGAWTQLNTSPPQALSKGLYENLRARMRRPGQSIPGSVARAPTGRRVRAQGAGQGTCRQGDALAVGGRSPQAPQAELRRRQKEQRVQTERDVLAASKHPFIATLHCSFQTKRKLYFVLQVRHGSPPQYPWPSSFAAMTRSLRPVLRGRRAHGPHLEAAGPSPGGADPCDWWAGGRMARRVAGPSPAPLP